MTPQRGNIVVGGRPHNIPLYREVCVDSDIAERYDIAPFHFRVCFTKFQRETRGGLAEHRKFLENRCLMKLARQEGRGVQTPDKNLKQVTSFNDVL